VELMTRVYVVEIGFSKRPKVPTFALIFQGFQRFRSSEAENQPKGFFVGNEIRTNGTTMRQQRTIVYSQ